MEDITLDQIKSISLKIENFGVIKCTDKIYGYLVNVVKVNSGVIKLYDTSESEFDPFEMDEYPDDNEIVNLGTYGF